MIVVRLIGLYTFTVSALPNSPLGFTSSTRIKTRKT
jgi:hypothetical protein